MTLPTYKSHVFWGRAYAASWFLVFATIFAFGWLQSFQNQQARSGQLKWEQVQREIARCRTEERDRIESQIRPLRSNVASQPFKDQLSPSEAAAFRRMEFHLHSARQTTTRQDLDQLLTGWELHEQRAIDNHLIAHWEQPQLAIAYDFEFQNDELLHWDYVNAVHYRAIWQNPTWPAWSETATTTRRYVVNMGLSYWLIATVTWLRFCPARLYAASSMLLAALMCGTAWLVNPRFALTSSGVISNGSLRFAAIMLLVSICLLAVTVTLYRNHNLNSPRMQFRLRDLLVLVTIASIFLAAGPFGYMALIVTFLGAALFAIAFFTCRQLNAPQASQPQFDVDAAGL